MANRYHIRFEHKILAAYIILGSIWILFSDNFLGVLARDKDTLIKFQTFKGWFYVLVTGIIFYFFLLRHLRKMRELEQKARESDRLKSAFLENLSHEIRTPMNGILGFAQLLQNSSFSVEEQKEFVKIIGQSSERMLLLINDLVTISNIKAGNISLLNSKIDVAKMLSFLCSIYKPQALLKGLELSDDFKTKSGQTVICADKEKLLSILSHLLRNAIKFSNQGIIKIGCVVEQNSANFFVIDSGIGIPESSLNSIFERFSQGSSNNSKGYDGIGLGLSISKDFIEIMGGVITVESKENEGTNFSFSIPLNSSIEDCAEGVSTDFTSLFDN